MNELSYTYYRKNGIVLILYSIIGLALIETIVAHVLLVKWNVTIAYVMTFLSLYSMLQIFALIKSYRYRPIYIDWKQSKLVLRHGFFRKVEVPLEYIERIETSTRALSADSEVVKLSPLGPIDSHNLIIYLNSELLINGMYGKKTAFRSLALFIDQKEAFVKQIEQQL